MKKESAVPGSSLRKMRRRGNWFTRILVISAVFICLAFLGREIIVAAVSRIELLSRQEVSQSIPIEGILIKEEKVIKSPVDGKLHYLAADGERLEVGAEAVQVFPLERDAGAEVFKLYAPCAGIFCTHTDMLESVLTPGNLDVLDFPKLEKVGGKPVPEGGKIEKGQPAFKIIDNLAQVYFYTKISKAAFPPDLAGRQEWLQASWENLPFLIKPVKITERGDAWESLFVFSSYPEKIVHQRKITLNVTTSRLSGLIVPRAAVIYRNGEPGIFIVVKKKARWTPVQVEGELAGKVAVSGPDLSENIRYVSNPVLVRDKWPVE